MATRKAIKDWNVPSDAEAMISEAIEQACGNRDAFNANYLLIERQAAAPGTASGISFSTS